MLHQPQEKLYCFGEHAVVYGEPALVVAITKRAFAEATPVSSDRIHVFSNEYQLEAEFAFDGRPQLPKELRPILAIVTRLKEYGLKRGFKLKIWSELPPGAGLGSSAAVSVASTAAISHLYGMSLSMKEIYEVSFEAEKEVHGTPSGVDNAIATYGSAILFKRGRIRRVKVDVDVPLVIGDTKVRRSTGDWVARVRDRKERHMKIVEQIIRAIGRISVEGLRLLREGRLREVGELMDVNQGLLDSLGVSTYALSNLIFAARGAGAYGAKLTGAGGGGCMVALASREKIDAVADAIENAGGSPLITGISMEGVRIEKG